MTKRYNAAELAELKLKALPSTVQGINALAAKHGWRTRRDVNGQLLSGRRKGRGGGWEYDPAVLPPEAQIDLAAREHRSVGAAAAGDDFADAVAELAASREALRWYDRQPDKKKAEARRRKAALQSVNRLWRQGLQKNIAVHEVARIEGVGASTIYNWFNLVAGHHEGDWLPLLCPRHEGRTAKSDCDPKAWEFLKGDYLRQSKPSFTSCYERLRMAAAKHGWTIPAERTLQRRMDAIWRTIKVYHREGPEALSRLYPPMERDRSMLHAMEAVNSDCHTFDVWVKWPGLEKPVRPTLIAVQDLYSNKIVGWRLDLSPNATAVRLCFYDVFRDFGIPEHAVLDNGREFAAKMLTGQQPTRFRFKVDPEETVGILTELGVKVHWTLPYSGQSKPIERAFRDFCDSIASHAAFDGAYTGNSPTNKPENYGSRAVPLDLFMEVVEQGLDLHNARPGRDTKVCGGIRSFDQAFAESYAEAPIRKAQPEHLRFCMLAAERVTARKPVGEVHLYGNRYWAEWMTNLVGEKLTAKYDPDDLHAGIELYRSNGAYIGPAPCWEATGFFDAEGARENARNKRAWTKAQRVMAEAERAMSGEQLLDLMVKADRTERPEAKVVRPVVGNTALRVDPQPDSEEDPGSRPGQAQERFDDAFAASVASLAAYRREQI